MEAGQLLQFEIKAVAIAAGSSLKLSLTGLPAGAVFDSASGAFRWTPDAEQVGSHELKLFADDGVLPVTKTQLTTFRPDPPTHRVMTPDELDAHIDELLSSG